MCQPVPRYQDSMEWLSASSGLARGCEMCTGPVLVIDARDGSPSVVGLQVFQEHVNLTTNDRLTERPIPECKDVWYNGLMLCSGTTMGMRTAMLNYLEIMHEDMKVWIEVPKCRFNINGDDQSIHN